MNEYFLHLIHMLAILEMVTHIITLSTTPTSFDEEGKPEDLEKNPLSMREHNI